MKSVVDNPFAHPKSSTHRITLGVMVMALIVILSIFGVYFYQISDPYVQEVLTLKGDAIKGHAMFQINCAGCHGWNADGSVGPSLLNVPKRKSKVSLIHQVISGKTPPMPKFQPSTQEMADLLSYLEQL
jgi:mono/diheme cytochrome c family protein